MESLSLDGFHVLHCIFLKTRNLSGTQPKYFVAERLKSHRTLRSQKRPLRSLSQIVPTSTK